MPHIVETKSLVDSCRFKAYIHGTKLSFITNLCIHYIRSTYAPTSSINLYDYEFVPYRETIIIHSAVAVAKQL